MERWSTETAALGRATVLDLLRYLSSEGFAAAPQVVEPGFDAAGRETITSVEGTSAHPRPWPQDVLVTIGATMRQLHELTRNLPTSRRAHLAKVVRT
jgi:hypothetical protein